MARSAPASAAPSASTRSGPKPGTSAYSCQPRALDELVGRPDVLRVVPGIAFVTGKAQRTGEVQGAAGVDLDAGAGAGPDSARAHPRAGRRRRPGRSTRRRAAASPRRSRRGTGRAPAASRPRVAPPAPRSGGGTPTRARPTCPRRAVRSRARRARAPPAPDRHARRSHPARGWLRRRRAAIRPAGGGRPATTPSVAHAGGRHGRAGRPRWRARRARSPRPAHRCRDRC